MADRSRRSCRSGARVRVPGRPDAGADPHDGWLLPGARPADDRHLPARERLWGFVLDAALGTVAPGVKRRLRFPDPRDVGWRRPVSRLLLRWAVLGLAQLAKPRALERQEAVERAGWELTAELRRMPTREELGEAIVDTMRRRRADRRAHRRRRRRGR